MAVSLTKGPFPGLHQLSRRDPEGLFGRLKNEFLYGRNWAGVSIEEFMGTLDAYLVYCNEERAKESLGWLSPMQFGRSLGLAA